MKIIAMGEILIDFVEKRTNGEKTFIAQPGGAPANALCMAAALGESCAFIGKAGNDQFGQLLSTTLEQFSIDQSGFILSEGDNTTLAFVHLDERGDRSFSFYRDNTADIKIAVEEIPESLFSEGGVFHFGTISLTHETNRKATSYALELAKEQEMLISFDPNIRPALWNDPQQIQQQIIQFLPHVDLLKVSEEELLLITDEVNMEVAVDKLKEQFAIPLIIVTLGEKGSLFYLLDKSVLVPGFDVEVIDTTGAGDCFVGTMLAQLLPYTKNLTSLNKDKVTEMVSLANKAAALSITKHGGIPSIPTKEQLYSHI